MSSCDSNTDSNMKDRAGDMESRMEQYQRQEREFLEFVAETQNIDSVDEDPDQPLSGLQCLLALTEILDRAVLLRKINFSLEQRIEELDQVKLLAEVKHSVRQAAASVDNNHGGMVKQKKTSSRQSSLISPSDEYQRSLSLQRVGSSESIDISDGLYGSSPRFESDDIKSRSLKGSILSETWGKMKGKLTSKDLTVNRVAKRHKSADLASSVPHTLSTPAAAESTSYSSQSSSLSLASTNAAAAAPAPTNVVTVSQFSQREVTISPTVDELHNDFGGVWLGEETDETTVTTTTTSSAAPAIDVGGVWLEPPETSSSNHHSKEGDQLTDMTTKEKARRNSSDPSKPLTKPHIKRSLPQSSESAPTPVDDGNIFPTKLINALTASRKKARVYDRPEGLDEILKNNTSPPAECPAAESTNVNKSPVLRKKSATKSSLVPGIKLPVSIDVKKPKKSDSSAVSKEFIKKMEEWNHIKEQSKQDESSRDSDKKGKQTKGSKSKTQRFKNRKRAEIWKQRSKSAERADSASRLSDEFEEKLREWSVKQGYHPTYYSEIRAKQGSVDSVEGQSDQRMRQMSDSEAFNSKDLKTLSSGDSASSLPANGLYDSEQNLQSLHNISQSADVVFVNRPKSLPHRKISRSAEAVNRVLSSDQSLLEAHPVVRTDKYSHIDLYAQASEESLEKHLSLCHITNEGDFERTMSPTKTTAKEKRTSNVFVSPTSIKTIDEQLHISSPGAQQKKNIFVYPSVNLVDNQTSSSSDEFLESVKIPFRLSKSKNVRINGHPQSHEAETKNESSESGTDNTVYSMDKDEEALLEQALMELENTLDREQELSSAAEKSRYSLRQSPSSQSDNHRCTNSTPAQPSTASNVQDDKLSRNVAGGPKLTDALSSKPLFNISKIKKTSLDSIIKAPSFTVMKEMEADTIEEATPISLQVDENSDGFNSKPCEHGMKVVRGKPPLSPRNSFHGSRTKSESDSSDAHAESLKADRVKAMAASPANTGCDINSNELVTGPETLDENPDSTDPLNVGPEVSLKMRLKSLAKEYEIEEEKRHLVNPVAIRPKSIASSGLQTTHKRTRSHDFLPLCSPNSFLPKQPVAGSYLGTGSGRPRPASLYLDANSGRTMGEGRCLLEVDSLHMRDRSNSISTSTQKDAVHRLQSADDIYNRRASGSKLGTMPHMRDTGVLSNDILRRRELQEKPKTGTVSKARSLFSDTGGSFNPQLGIDFNPLRTQQLS